MTTEQAFLQEMREVAIGALLDWMQGYTDPNADGVQRRIRACTSKDPNALTFKVEPGCWPEMYTRIAVQVSVSLDKEEEQ